MLAKGQITITNLDDGIGIKSVKGYYAISASSVTAPSNWGETPKATDTTNRYLWSYEVYTYSNGDVKETTKRVIGTHGATGANGSDGISPIVGFLTNESITLPASSTGVVSSFTGATGVLNVYEGTALRNAQATYSVVSQSSITVSITQSGVYMVSAMTSGASVLSGTAILRAVYNGVTIDKILTVTKALAGTQGATGATGSAGQNATTYWINASTNAIKKDVSGVITPKTITFSGFSKTGTANPVAYAGRFIIQTSTDGVSYTTAYTSSANQSSYTYTVPTTASFVKARYYLAGGTSTLLDEQTIPVLVDAEGIDKKYQGQSLLDKTEILSGTEIFTDKSDDSVVHVEIDGKSIGGGSGKNLIRRSTEITVVAPDNQAWIFDTLRFDTLTAGKRYVFSANVEILAGTLTNGSNMSVLARKSDGSSSLSDFVGTTIQNGRIVGSMVANADIDRIYLYAGTAGYTNGNTVKFTNIQLEQNDVAVATTFELPAPSPEYPIEIHSLNDFDVVSSVGKENLFSLNKFINAGAISKINNGFRITNSYGTIIASYIKPDIKPGKTYTISGEITTLEGVSTSVTGRFVMLSKVPDSTSNLALYNGTAKKFSNTFTVPNDFNYNNYHGLYAYGISNGIVEFVNIKIEEGSVATPYCLSLEDADYDTNSIFIDKTNISLSEPLRSVGDVKDRLFRDSDGLWKVERNVGEHIFEGTEGFGLSSSRTNTTLFNYSGWHSTQLSGAFTSSKTSLNSHFAITQSSYASDIEGQAGSTAISGMYISIRKSIATSVSQLKAWLVSQKNSGTPMIVYFAINPTVETLPQADQDKLNNIASYRDSNYLYTIVDKTNILPEYVRDNLKPNLKATFKGGGWYARFKTEQRFNQTNKSVDSLKNETIPALKDGLLNSSEKEVVKQSLNVVSADKKGIDMQFATVYANTALTGIAKTNIHSSKVALNTAFANLQSAINAVLGVGDGTRITATQMTLVTTRLNEYGTALSTYNQRYEQAQDAISTEKKRLGDAYALAQATLAETQAKAHADGKITAEEERAIADAQAKLDEAKKYVDDLEIGGRNLIAGTSEEALTLGGYPASGYSEGVTGKTILTPDKDSYVLSFEAKSTVSGDRIRCHFYNPNTTTGAVTSTGYTSTVRDGTAELSLTNQWKRYWVKYTQNGAGTTSPKYWVVGRRPAGFGTGTISVKEIKLEEGNKPTDWTPAPEDVETAYRAVSKAERELAEVNAKAYADGVVSAEEERAIQDAKDKLTEAQNHAQGLVDNIKIGGRNLISRRTIEKDKYLDHPTGSVLDASGHAITGFLAVKPNTEYILSAELLWQYRALFYTSGRTRIDGSLYSGNQGQLRVFTTPDNCYWMRFSGSYTDGSPLESWMFEEGNKPSAYKLAPEDEVMNRNLLLESGEVVESSNYMIKRYDLAEKIPDETTITLTIWGNLASSKTYWGIYSDGGTTGLPTYPDYIGNGMYKMTAPWKVSPNGSNDYICIHTLFSTQTGLSRIDKIKLEYGDIGTDWNQAQEDISNQIGDKASQEDLNNIENNLNTLYEQVNNLNVETIKDQLAEYQEVLSGVKADSNESKAQLDRILSEENGALAIINTILDKFNERWTTLDGFIEINSSETALSINKGNTNMVIDSDSLTFYSGGEPVATITNQYMKIDRGIFVQSMHVGRHQWAPLKSNKDHFILSYVGDVPG